MYSGDWVEIASHSSLTQMDETVSGSDGSVKWNKTSDNRRFERIKGTLYSGNQ